MPIQTLYIEKSARDWISWSYSDGDTCRFYGHSNKQVIITKAKKQGFNKFVILD